MSDSKDMYVSIFWYINYNLIGKTAMMNQIIKALTRILLSSDITEKAFGKV